MIRSNDSNSFELENNGEINIKSVLKKFKRNILLIFTITSLSTIYSIYYSLKAIPIYSGQFQVLVRDEENNSNSGVSISGIPKSLIKGSSSGAKKTQELLLKSPLVLNPVYEFVKAEYLKRNQDITNLTYKKWINRSLSFEFIDDDSDVFEIIFKDRDKDLILSTLSMISDTYKIYSKKDHTKNLIKEQNYLKQQEIIYKERYEESFNNSKNFVIENNLYSSNCNSVPNKASFTKNDSEALLEKLNTSGLNSSANTIRYSEQFASLDSLELNRAKYSTTLKPNSEYLRKLDSQILKLKEGIQRPARILLKNKDLTNKMCRDESTVNSIQNRIIKNQLDLANQKDPWELISTPTVNEQAVYPKKKNMVISFFFVSIFISLIISLLKDSLMGFVDEIDDIKAQLHAKYLGNISKDNYNSEINVRIFKLIIKKILENKVNKKTSNNIGIYCLKNTDFISNYTSLNGDISFKDLTNLNEINNFQNILFTIDSKSITSSNIKLLNKYVDTYIEKNFYWIYVENEKFF